MKYFTIILPLLLLTLKNCSKQPIQSKALDIQNRTYELSEQNIWTPLNDKERIDGYTRVGDYIFGGEIACNVEPLKGIDVKTFKVLVGTKFAKDTNHIYYPLETLCVEDTDCCVCYYTKIIVDGANPSTFRYLGKDYAVDGGNVYFRGELFQGADGATFNIIDGPEFFYFATDKNYVYCYDQILKEADPLTFHLVREDSGNNFSEYDSKYLIADKNKVWEYTPPTQFKEISRN